MVDCVLENTSRVPTEPGEADARSAGAETEEKESGEDRK